MHYQRSGNSCCGLWTGALLLAVLAAVPEAGAAPARKPARKPVRPAGTRSARPAPTRIVRLEVEPRTVRLSGLGATARLVVSAVRADGTVRDVSREAIPAAHGAAVGLLPGGRVVARRNGVARVELRLGGASATARVEVSEAGKERPASYAQEVFPLFSRAGCSQGVCHGNANGKGGLKLSLRGQEPATDYEALLHAAGGRRVNRADPGNSLLLLKPSGVLPHAGGLRMKPGSDEYRLLARWIAEGARSDLPKAPEVTELVLFPAERVLYGGPGRAGLSQQLRASARYSDGTTRDVTGLASYESSDETVTIDPDGLVEAPGGGEAGINVRYGGQMATARLTFVPQRPAFTFQPFPERNLVDRHVLAKLRTVRLQPSPVCDDSTFLRRVYLDGLGFPPTPEEARAFLAECDAEKAERSAASPAVKARARLVDRLLQRPEFGDFWVVKWADLLRAEERSLDPEGMQALYGWLRESFRQNKPMDQFVRELLTSTGSTYDNPAASFFRRTRSPDLLAENTAQLFMGVRMACARCHNHPYDRWKQSDYHALAAYFARVGRETKHKPRRQRFDAEEINGDELIVLRSTGEWMNPATGEPMPPGMLGDPASVPAADAKDRRAALADWLTRPENPFFAKAMVNRVWYHLLGRGIVDPVDDFRESNPPTNRPLLDALSTDFATNGFDLRRLVGTIMNSSTYQLSAAPNAINASDEKYFSHALAPRLTAEQLFEAISSVTGAPESFPGHPPGTHLTQVVPTWEVHPFLRLFGQPPRETVCECERNGEPTLGQSFELISGREIDSRLRAPGNRLARL
ncbi:MAG: DUF1549 domain-containing protein, partial [Actinomycetota bacterium]